MKRCLLMIWIAVVPLVLSAHTAREPLPNEEVVDTLISVQQVQITAIKQSNKLRTQPIASSILGERTLSMQGVSAIKEVRTLVRTSFFV